MLSYLIEKEYNQQHTRKQQDESRQETVSEQLLEFFFYQIA